MEIKFKDVSIGSKFKVKDNRDTRFDGIKISTYLDFDGKGKFNTVCKGYINGHYCIFTHYIEDNAIIGVTTFSELSVGEKFMYYDKRYIKLSLSNGYGAICFDTKNPDKIYIDDEAVVEKLP